jgi:hypothetical protein
VGAGKITTQHKQGRQAMPMIILSFSFAYVWLKGALKSAASNAQNAKSHHQGLLMFFFTFCDVQLFDYFLNIILRNFRGHFVGILAAKFSQ